MSELGLSGAVRVLTHPRITAGEFTSEDVISRGDDLLRASGVSPVRPSSRHWRIFRDLCISLDACGNLVADCYHAALAIDNDATFVSNDRFFDRVPDLAWCRPW